MFKGKSKQNIRGSARKVKRLKSVKKDYQNKCLNNPFFRRRQKKKKSNHKSHSLALCLLIFLLLSVSALFYLFFVSDNFLIQKIEINGLTRSSDQEIVDMIWSQSEDSKLIFLKQKNLLCFNVQELQTSLNDNFSFANLVIKKKWPHTLIINVEERALAFIWQDGENVLFSDCNGCLIPEVIPSSDDFSNYPVLKPIIKNAYILDNNCLNIDNEYLGSLIDLDAKIRTNNNLVVKDYFLESEINALTVNLESGPKVYFNIKNEFDKQIEKLIVIKNKKTELEFQALEYIDLRYGDRVYFK